MEGTVLHYLYLLHQVGQAADSRGLCGSLLAANQYTAQCGVDQIQHKGKLHFFLPNDSSKRIRMLHSVILLFMEYAQIGSPADWEETRNTVL